jgi:hypothetical protein
MEPAFNSSSDYSYHSSLRQDVSSRIREPSRSLELLLTWAVVGIHSTGVARVPLGSLGACTLILASSGHNNTTQ